MLQYYRQPQYHNYVGPFLLFLERDSTKNLGFQGNAVSISLYLFHLGQQ